VNHAPKSAAARFALGEPANEAEGKQMIITVTSFALPRPVTRAEARGIFETTAPTYRGVPGLLKKHYVLADDGASVGGVYIWKSRKDAEAMYTDAWRAFVRDKYKTEPKVTYFDNPLDVDNVDGRIVLHD
jgi:hypothetical protein